MKKLLSLILSFLFLLTLTACGVLSNPDETEPAESEKTITETADQAKTDHEILPDYKTAVPSGEHDVRILFINVGKADAILLEIDGKHYLVDTGTTDSVPAVLTAMAYMDCTSLEGMFVTHSHNDHVGGADEICSVFPVKTYFTPAISGNMLKLSAPALTHGIDHVKLEPGACVPLSDGVFFEVLAPYRYNPGDDNNNSMVMKLRVNGVSVLLASDMLYDEEKTLLNRDFDLSADILKVGHHGRRDATSIKFLDAVSPETAIISTDSKEEPDSPHYSILAMLEEMGADIHVTEDYDLGILVTIEKNGSYSVENAHIEKKTNALLEIVALSADEQSVDIRNNGSDEVNMEGYFLFSTAGSEIFVFPDGTILAPGEKLCVVGQNSTVTADFVWSESRPWNANKKDTAVLFDKYGNVLDEAVVE